MQHQHRVNINEPFQAHELTFSCYRRFQFLKAVRTCEWLAEAITDARETWQFSLWAYVFMPDHVHLVISPQQQKYDIANIRRAIKAPVARKAIDYLQLHAPGWLPRITRKRGKKTERLFWQSGGGYDRNVCSGSTLVAMIDYIHANPVRKQFVARPEEWFWSSAAWFAEGKELPLAIDPIPPEWLEGEN